MIPLIPTLALAFLSFIASAFVILRIVIPILPPHPLSKRVAPSEFGLPNFRSLSPADKTHIWLASFDLMALTIFIWQAVMESLGGPSGLAVAGDVESSLRLWFAMTIRQTFLLVAASITLLHVRMGRSISFGLTHWVLWAPTVLLVTISTSLAGVLTGAGVSSFFVGLVSYSSTIAVLSSAVFCCLVGTLIAIQRNLAALNDAGDWPPPKQLEEKPRPSFATEEIDALRDGSSWITSNASSHRGSISNWSFSTHQTRSHHSHVNHAKGSYPSTIPAKSSFWFNPATPHNNTVVPPVPPLPSPYRHSAATVGLDDPDPFRRDVPGLPQRARMGSQSSWLTSPSASQVTLSQWSYPTTHHGASTPDLLPSTAVSRSVTPALAHAQVLGGYGYSPQKNDSEQALASLAVGPGEIDVSIYRAISWLLAIWVPFALTLPYLLALSLGTKMSSDIVSILLTLSVTLSSPILALNVLFKSSMPIPQGLFDNHDESPSQLIHAASPSRTSLAASFAHEYKRSTSVTVVESRRSTDVWISKGEAVDGKSKLSRAMSILARAPKLSILPHEETSDGEVTPPLPMQRLEETPVPCSAPQTPHSDNSVELGEIMKISNDPGIRFINEENLGYQSKIMVAQRHYSAMAQTIVLTASPDRQLAPDNGRSASTAVASRPGSSRPISHIRARSNSSITHSHAPSPPPPFPLPPTPPSVKASKRSHRKSFSSGFSYKDADDVNQIDALSAGVLPRLVHGLKIGKDVHIRKDWDFSPPVTLSKGSRDSREFGQLMDDEFESPELHSTPVKRGVGKPQKTPVHKRNHFSLPSLGLSKSSSHSLTSWKAEVNRALESEVDKHLNFPTAELERRYTVCESVPTSSLHLNAVREEEEDRGVELQRAQSNQSRGLRSDVPTGRKTGRESVNTMLLELQGAAWANQPNSAASTATLFEFEPNGGPQAQSTPHFQKTPPLSLSKHGQHHHPLPNSTSQDRRSSIVYIKSEDNDSKSPPSANPTPTNSTNAFAQWSSRAVRPLMPKASKLQRKMSEKVAGSPGGGLRQLSLLQDRDTNAAEASLDRTRPLLLGKKQLRPKDENATPGSAGKSRVLKPLQLARSETSKLRGILRKGEVLPNVVVRPPSTSEHSGFAYNFR